jgi:type I restriction enzyme, S subunit
LKFEALGNLTLKIGSGATPRGGDASYKREGIPLIRSLNVHDGQFINRGLAYIDSEQAARLDNAVVEPSDVLLNITGASVCRCAIVPDNLTPARVNQHVCILRTNPTILSARYLMHLLVSPRIKTRLLAMARRAGATREALTKGEIEMFEIPVPGSLKEQNRIAMILDKADAIRRKRQQAILLADNFLRSVFLDMFGDPGLKERKSSSYKISELIEQGILDNIQDGNHGNDHPKVADFTTAGIPFVTANVIRRNSLDLDNCYHLDESWLQKLRVGFAKPRDVVITHKGTLGETVVLNDRHPLYILSPQSTYYRCNDAFLLPEYLKAYFDTSYFQAKFKKEGVQSTRAYIGITRQKDLNILLPSLELQKKFQEIVFKVERTSKLLNAAYNQSSLLTLSLAQAAFSGDGS